MIAHQKTKRRSIAITSSYATTVVANKTSHVTSFDAYADTENFQTQPNEIQAFKTEINTDDLADLDCDSVINTLYSIIKSIRRHILISIATCIGVIKYHITTETTQSLPNLLKIIVSWHIWSQELNIDDAFAMECKDHFN